MDLYDITDPKRLQRVAKVDIAVGQRVHFSIYLCELDGSDLVDLERKIDRIIDVQTDILRYLPLRVAERAATSQLADLPFANLATPS